MKIDGAIVAAALLVNAVALPAMPETLTLAQVVAASLRHYPSVRVSKAQVRGAAAQIANARTAYLPKIELIAGADRATRNNVLGLLLPSQVIASTTGPVLGVNGTASAWGSSVGTLVSWEPFDFGLRAANVAAAQKAQTRSEAMLLRSTLELSTLAADSALTLLAAQQTEIAAQAAVDRADDLVRITEALVKAELRPGADASLARAESAAAQAQLIRARQAIGVANVTLSTLLGSGDGHFDIVHAHLLSLPGPPPQNRDLQANPIAREHMAALEEAHAQLRAVDRGYVPRFSLGAAAFARGTGALPDGRLLPGADGLAPNVPNWAVGLTVDFSPLDLPSIHARRQAASAQLEAEQAGKDQALLDLKQARDKALIDYQAARALADTTPVEIEASRAAMQQTRARYQAGLGGELEVAEAQRRLAQAEIDDSLARLGVWRARLALYAADGDISPLLAETEQ